MIVNLANLSRSCLRPTFSNSTVILQLSPVSSRMGFTCGFRVYLSQPFARRRSNEWSRCRCAICIFFVPSGSFARSFRIEWKSVPRYGFSGRLLFGLYRHIDVSRIEVFDEPAWRRGDRLSVTIAGEGIREGAVFFCAGDGHIEQTSFFFDFPFTVFTHGRRKEVFFYSNNENLFELQSFRCMDRHQGYFVLLGFIAVVLICRQRNFG